MDRKTLSRSQLREEADRQNAIKKAKQVIAQAKKPKKSKARGRRLEQKAAGLYRLVREWDADPREVLKVDDHFDVRTFSRDATPGWSGSKKEAQHVTCTRGMLLSELQERLFASARGSNTDAVLVILQGMDTAGKGGIVRHVMGMVDPQGVVLSAFKAPTAEELKYNFLWRITQRIPTPGLISVFDRSHYEDLLVPIAQDLTGHTDEHGRSWRVSDSELERRFHAVQRMEEKAIKRGIRVIKICLLVSYQEQGKRLRERLDRPDKYWKFSPADLLTREDWAAHQEAYGKVLKRTSYDEAPWYVVPADKKWYARLAVTEILTRELAEIDPQWPPADFDVVHAREALNVTLTPGALNQWENELSKKQPHWQAQNNAVEIAVDALGS